MFTRDFVLPHSPLVSRFEDVDYFIFFLKVEPSFFYLWISTDKDARPKPRTQNYTVTVKKGGGKRLTFSSQLKDLEDSLETVKGDAVNLANLCEAPSPGDTITVVIKVCQ